MFEDNLRKNYLPHRSRGPGRRHGVVPEEGSKRHYQS